MSEEGGRERRGEARSGEEGERCRVFQARERRLPSAVTHTRSLPLLLAAVSSLRLIRGWWQGAVALPADLEGVMMGASGQGPQEGGLLVVIPCYLCRGHRGQLHPHTHTHTHTHTLSLTLRQLQLAQFSVCPWEKNGKREANSGECLPRRTPHPIHLQAPSLSLSPPTR